MSRPATPLVFSSQARPSSPPETPTTSTFLFGKTNHTTKRQGMQNFSHPYPSTSGNIDPVGQGPHFQYKRSVRPEDISPRSSSPDSDSSGTQPRSASSSPAVSEDEETPPKSTKKASIRISRVLTQGNFTIQELHSSDIEDDRGYDSDDALSVIQPDHYEDAATDSDAAHSHTTQPPLPRRSLNPNTLDALMMEHFDRLDCNDSTERYEAYKKKERKLRRQKRLSSGSIGKRTLSQSIGSDTDDEDLQDKADANEAGSSARRLRRKTGPGDRSSLLFDDPPQRIVEELEPESGDEGGMGSVAMQVMEPDVDIDVDVDSVLMHALPYYELGSEDNDSMEVDDEDVDSELESDEDEDEEEEEEEEED